MIGDTRDVRGPAAVAIVILLATAVVAAALADGRSEQLAAPLETISRDIAGFHSSGTTDGVIGASVLQQLKPTSYVVRRYQRGDKVIDLFVAFYAQQRAGESMHSPKHCFPGAGWEMWDSGKMPLPTAEGAVDVNRYIISREGERLLMFYWYQSKNSVIASEYEGKLVLARDAILRHSTAAAIVRVTAADRRDMDEPARQFAMELEPEVRRCFRGN